MTRFLILTVLVIAANVLRADQVDDYINAKIQSAPVPGVTLTVLKKGKELKTGAYGVANLELDTPTTLESVFELGALSSEFTAAGILLLSEEGKLSLDDPIRGFLRNAPSAWKEVTIRHCLTHTSGIKSYSFVDGFELRHHLKQDDFIRLIGEYPLEFEPGSKFAYSTTDATLLGHIIANVSEQSYWSYVDKKIFKPLHMAVYNRDPLKIIPNRAGGYIKEKSGGFSNRDYDLTDMFAAADLCTSVVDFAKWDQALNGTTILNEESRRLFWTAEEGRTSGFIFRVGKLKGNTEHSYIGSTGGYSTAHLRFPDNDISIILFANNSEANIAASIARGVAGFYLDEK